MLPHQSQEMSVISKSSKRLSCVITDGDIVLVSIPAVMRIMSGLKDTHWRGIMSPWLVGRQALEGSDWQCRSLLWRWRLLVGPLSTLHTASTHCTLQCTLQWTLCALILRLIGSLWRFASELNPPTSITVHTAQHTIHYIHCTLQCM